VEEPVVIEVIAEEVSQERAVERAVVIGVRDDEERGERLAYTERDPDLVRVDLKDAQRLLKAVDRAPLKGLLHARREPLGEHLRSVLIVGDLWALDEEVEEALHREVEREQAELAVAFLDQLVEDPNHAITRDKVFPSEGGLIGVIADPVSPFTP
jgi:hypothetical protein